MRDLGKLDVLGLHSSLQKRLGHRSASITRFIRAATHEEHRRSGVGKVATGYVEPRQCNDRIGHSAPVRQTALGWNLIPGGGLDRQFAAHGVADQNDPFGIAAVLGRMGAGETHRATDVGARLSSFPLPVTALR